MGLLGGPTRPAPLTLLVPATDGSEGSSDESLPSAAHEPLGELGEVAGSTLAQLSVSVGSAQRSLKGEDRTGFLATTITRESCHLIFVAGERAPPAPGAEGAMGEERVG